VGSIAPDEGLHALETLLQEGRTQAAVAAVDWPKLFRTDAGAAALDLLAELAPGTGPDSIEHSPRPSELLDRIRRLPAGERRPAVLHYLSDLVIAALQWRSEEPLDPRRRLFEIGVDSILALELKDRLERAAGVKLSATLLFVYPTLEALADYILTELIGDEAPIAPTVPPPASTLSDEDLTRILLREIDVSHGA
jgi:acyl carrier protein